MTAAQILRAPKPADIAMSLITAAAGVGILLLGDLLVAEQQDPAAGFPRPGSAAWLLVLAVVLVQSVILVWARHAPASVLCAVPTVVLLFALSMPGPVLDVAVVAVPITVFLVFRAGSSRPPWWPLAVAAVLLGAAGYFNGVTAENAEPLGALGEAVVQVAGMLGIPLLLANLLRARRESRDSQRRELLALRRERDALVEAAVARERTAMARELHDIAAHHLSGIALMAAAVQRQVLTRPEAAQTDAGRIRTEAMAVLQNLRRVVGLLREDGSAERSVESFATVPDLVEELSHAGRARIDLEITRSTDGRPLAAGVGPLAQLAAYRTIQESLVNAGSHAPGATCAVQIDDTDPAEVLVHVKNGPPSAADPAAESSAGGGFGLVGMRERADLVGALLQYGRTRDGGWEVHLRVPRDVTADESHLQGGGEQ